MTQREQIRPSNYKVNWISLANPRQFTRINFNLFHYAGNNPVKYVDPDGRLDMHTSEDGVNFIVNYEGGYQSQIYDARNPSNKYEKGKTGDWTIGFGHKLTPEELQNGTYENGIDENTAKALFASDLGWFEDGINKNFDGETLSQTQFDALVSLGYNIGRSGLVNSAVFADAETGETGEQKILTDFKVYNTAKGQYLEGLDKRRIDEAELYLYGDYQRNDDLTLDNPNKKEGNKK